MSTQKTMPLCESILDEFWGKAEGNELGYAVITMADAEAIIRKQFAALSLEEVARVHAGISAEEWPRLLPETRSAVARASNAQAVMKLLRKE